MPFKNGHLTAKERAFAEALARTGDAGYAAHIAGYKGHAEAARVAGRAPVQEHAAKQRERSMLRLVGEGTELAVETLFKGMRSEDAKDRRESAKIVMTEVRQFLEKNGSSDKPNHEMSFNELVGAGLDDRIVELELFATRIESETVEPSPSPLDQFG